MTSSSLGVVWLVGAGPGDPRLITVRGRDLLAEADVVLYDALSHPDLLHHCRPDAELRSVGKRGGSKSPSQAWITQQLIDLARQGKRVLRLKGGDPSLFARGAEEARALCAAGIPFEIVPGLPSPVAAAAYAGIPLTHRELSSSVTFITGHDREGQEWSPAAWQRLATATETICVLMGMSRLREICEAIIAGGRDPHTPAAAVQWAARPAQRTVVSELSELPEAVAQAGLRNPAVVLIGKVVGLREELRWFDKLPLFGRRILVPRPAHQAQSTADAVRSRGAEPVLLPAIRICDPPQPERLAHAVSQLSSYDYCVFTSANGVQRTMAELSRQQRDARAFGSCKIATIGPKTSQALTPYGLRSDVVAEEFVGESLADALLEQTAAGQNILIPRALVAREELPNRLRAAGRQVDVVPAYQTLGADEEQRITLQKAVSEGRVDSVLFTSSSTVDSVVEALGDQYRSLLADVTLASIGPITAQRLRHHGLEPSVQATEYTIDGLLTALGSPPPTPPEA